MVSQRFQHLWQQAAAFAARQHQGQLRKDGQTPYFAHPVRVALTVRHVFNVDDETALAAALLHDLIEDTTTDYDDLLEQFGKEVADAVAALTKDARLEHDQREAAYDHQLAQASWQARLVKLADVYDNFCDARNDQERQKFAVKAERAIRCAGDAPELQSAITIVQQLVSGRGEAQEPSGAAPQPTTDKPGQVTTQVLTIDPAWVLVTFQGPRPAAERRVFLLHRTMQEWLALRPGLAIRRTLAIQDAGELIGVHFWLGDRSQAEQRTFPVKIHYRLVDQVPAEHLEALLAHAYEIFFEHPGSNVGALAIISRSGRAVVFDRASEQCFVLPLDEMRNLDEHARQNIHNWQTQQSTNYFVMELGGFETMP
jgi:guanosine-3',5'-bis(diphosphate) 3'-pyrophosphohydrolase